MSLSIFARLTKVDEEKRLVYGQAASETPDQAGEVFDYETSKPYFEKWSGDIAKATDGKSLGNVRAMHKNIAAGKLTSIEFLDDAKAIDIVTKVVDDDEWNKVLEGVYTGFSIGGDYVKKWADGTLKRYTADPSEISLVDNPCIPTARFFDIQKADGSTLQKAFKDPEAVTEPVVQAATPDEATLALAKMLTEAGIDADGFTALVAKAAAATAPAAAPVAAAAAEVPPAPMKKTKLSKGMYGVSEFAYLLQSIQYLQQDAEWEKDWEGDSSDMPDKLKAWLAQGGDLLRAMVDEEVKEMVGDADDVVDLVIALSAKPGELQKRFLEKAGAKFSTDTKEKLGKAHQAIKDADEHMKSIGYDKADEDDTSSTSAEKVAPAPLAKTDDIGDLVKNAVATALQDTNTSLAKLATENTDLKTQLAKVLAQPAAGKGVLRTVEKGADIDTAALGSAAVEPVRSADGGVDVAATEIKKIHQGGGRILTHR